jgi:hypothetical protein
MTQPKWFRTHGGARDSTALRQLISMLLSDALTSGYIKRGAALDFRFAVRPVKPKTATWRTDQP